MFWDELFTLNIERSTKICKEIVKKGYNKEAQVKKAGFKIGEIPTVERRCYGKSKLSIPYHGFKVLWIIIQKMFSKEE